MTFEKWMYLVDNLLVIRIGLDSMSLYDADWYSDFEDGLTPEEAVDFFIEEYYQD